MNNKFNKFINKRNLIILSIATVFTTVVSTAYKHENYNENVALKNASLSTQPATL